MDGTQKKCELWWGNVLKRGHLEDNMKINLREISCEHINWMNCIRIVFSGRLEY
jgi:hypothetical protein